MSMSKVCIKFVKTHEDAKLPTKAHNGDNCFDLYAVEDTVIPRSSYGPIDEVKIGNAVVPVGKMYNFSDKDYTFNKGDKVAQIKIEKIYDTEIEWTDEVEQAQRGDAGFGSSGK